MMDEYFVITYETDSGLIRGEKLVIKSPQMSKKQVAGFIASIKDKKLLKLSVNGPDVDAGSEVTFDVLREAKLL